MRSLILRAVWPLLLAVAACGGRVSNPIPATTPLDAQLSCDHLRAERSVNERRIADLKDEKESAARNNVGFLLVQPLFLDVKGSERQEISAFEARDQVLDELIAKRCATAGAS